MKNHQGSWDLLHTHIEGEKKNKGGQVWSYDPCSTYKVVDHKHPGGVVEYDKTPCTSNTSISWLYPMLVIEQFTIIIIFICEV